MTTITLSKPVEHNGTTYSALTFREATIGDLIVGDAVTGELTKTMAVLASISDTPLPAFKKIRAKDLTAIMKATADLLGNEPEPTTGE
ncbi:phage tail assembly protein [Neorhizobium galegae]|jgi:hypothetical protein|uniref:Phage tail assembly protein n=1 Tax=Neorhizobium galegae TaxID=399 RepID=A0A6A1TSE9_NEOGA|nr:MULTISPECIES: phage tail assembly protein [Neorhizobium]KAB1086494.1 phage tail assembly protein [Neorhizobium galegae]